MRRLLLLVGAIVLVDMAFYAAIVPLLPVYAERYALTKTGAGVLAGSYAVGTLLGALPSGWLAARVGSRRTVLVGLVLLSLASAGFALARSVALLDAMRFLQGLGGACSWAGGFGWLLSQTPPGERGRTIGLVMSAALGGLLLGPLLGALARAVGPGWPFEGVAVLGAGLAWAAARMPEAPLVPAAQRAARPLATALGEARVRAGMALVTVAALVFGAVDVLTPLELDRLGASGLAIGATFLVASAIEAVLQPLSGRAADRHGRGWPLRVALAGAIAFLVLLPLPQTALVLAALVAIGSAVCGTVNTPAMALIADGVAGVGLDHGFGFALVNLVWATGQVGGTVAGGALAGATSDAVPYLLLAGICAATLAAVVRGGRLLLAPSGAA
jgi:MFS family permease